jgi:regulator of sigma E protease
MMERLMTDTVRFADFRFPFVIDSLVAGGGAARAGLQPGDRITQLDGKDVDYPTFYDTQRQRPRTASHTQQITYVRAGTTDTISITTDSLFNIGVYVKPIPVKRLTYNFFTSFPAGIKLGVETLQGYVYQMKYVFTKTGAKQLGGFATIGSIFPKVWDWHQFWYMTAFLSIILAFMNILPIPALDGGHVLFLIYEVVTRRKPSDKFMERAQMVGMALIFILLIWANFNDVVRFLFK